VPVKNDIGARKKMVYVEQNLKVMKQVSKRLFSYSSLRNVK